MSPACEASLDGVRVALTGTAYPMERIRFVVGPVEDTLPRADHEAIAMLRLDTDWYESTRAEMDYLFDRVIPGGVVIFDHYGWWNGHRRAIDEYLAAHRKTLLLNRIDGAAPIAIVR